jgi:anti-anti-sigma factor
VSLDGNPHTDFNADELTVQVPDDGVRHKIKVTISPSRDPFDASTEWVNGEAHITLNGTLDASTFGEFQTEIENALQKKPAKIVLFLSGLESMASVGIRVLLFARQKMSESDKADIIAVGAKPEIAEAILRADPDQEDIAVVDTYEAAK